MASSKKDAKRRRRAQQLAERAARFERHAALVAARAGDPRYPQRIKNADGSYSVFISPEAVEMLRQQQRSFREKFGREMGPGDPVFFDPDADEPITLSADRYNELFIEAAEGIEDPELRALALASADVGYMVTEENQHLFTAHEVEAFGVAVSHRRRENEDLDSDFPAFLAEQLQRVVALIAEGVVDPDLPRHLIERLLDDSANPTKGEVGPVLALMVMTPFKWVIAVKSLGISESDLNTAVNWIADNLGGLDYAGPAATAAAAIWGGEAGEDLKRSLGKSDELTFSDLHDALGQDFGPAMIWLCAGLLATVGGGDIDWLLRLEQSDNE
jgi:hypothetical protein